MLGRELAIKLKEVLDRALYVIYQDLPDTNLGEPLEAVVSKDGRIVVERVPSGPRQGQWLFNRATVESLDRLYDVQPVQAASAGSRGAKASGQRIERTAAPPRAARLAARAGTDH